MIRDENWYDAVGKDMWRWEQELKDIEKHGLQKDKNSEHGQLHNTEGSKLFSKES